MSEPKSPVITLQEPIQRATGEPITELTLRKPKAGELRGLKIEDLWNTDINALFTLLPRITTPALIPEYLDQLCTEDLMDIGGTVKGFFMNQAMQDQVAKMFGVESTG